MPSAAESLQDALLSHQIGLQRLSNREAREALAILEHAERRISSRIRQRLLVITTRGADPGPFTTQQLRLLVAEIRRILADAYRQIGQNLEAELLELAPYEVDYTRKALKTATLGAPIALETPVWPLLRSIVTDDPFQNGVIRDYFRPSGRNSLAAKATRRYSQVIRREVGVGLLDGSSIETIARKIRRQVIGIPRNGLAATVDSAIKHVSQSARQAFLAANAGPEGVVKGYQWLSTLDLRTTIEWCVPRDGKVYDTDFQPVDHSYPWLDGPGRVHWRCRSGMTAVLKSWREMGIDAEELTRAQRASMDGHVPAHVTAEGWLRSKSEADLERVFGKRRAGLFKEGKLSVDDMVKRDGTIWTLKELREREARAFG